MNNYELLNNDFSKVLLVAGFIFLARVIDVALGTLRSIFAARGYQKLAPIIGFFESLMWLIVIQQIMSNMSNFLNIIAYAGGFAAGTYVGIAAEKLLSIGDVLVRIIIPGNGFELSRKLRNAGFAITEINAAGRDGTVTLFFSLIPRKEFQTAKKLIEDVDKSIVYTAEDVRLLMGVGKRWKNNPVHNVLV